MCQMLTILILNILAQILCSNSNSPNESNQPHILLIIMDQYRHDAMSVWGNDAIDTPHIDSIAKDGILFRNAYTSTPTCTPARAAILTGRSPWGHGMLGYGKISMKYPFEMINTLNQNNYMTAIIGKNHYGWLNSTVPVLHGFKYHQIYDGGGNGFPNTTSFGYDDYDNWFQLEKPGQNPLKTGLPNMDWNSWRGASYVYENYYHPTKWATRMTSEFLQYYFNNTNNNINNNTNINPLFLKLSYHRPHSPYDPPFSYLNKTIKKNNIPNLWLSNEWDLKYKIETKYCGDWNKDAWCGYMPQNLSNISRAAYYSNIEFIDNGIGDILKLFKQYNIYNNTLIILTADHGDMQGDHYLWRKMYPYESAAHIPMLLKWPNTIKSQVPRGSELTSVVELRDILPTILNSANIAIPENITLEGMNMLCLLESNNNCEWREYIDMEHDICYNKTNHWNGLTDGNWKYIFNAYFPQEQLFNLINDPKELHDLAPKANNNETINQILSMWRQRMVTQFENEERGTDWVVNGTLQQRQQSQLYSPNYPGDPPPRKDLSDELYRF